MAPLAAEVEVPMFPCRTMCDAFVAACSFIIPANLLPNCGNDYPTEGSTMPLFVV